MIFILAFRQYFRNAQRLRKEEKMHRYLTVAMFVLASSPSMVFAQPHSGSASEQRACGADAVRHCRASLEGGDLAIANCLSVHRERLNHACRAVLASQGL
jgi:hypothetical protein